MFRLRSALESKTVSETAMISHYSTNLAMLSTRYSPESKFVMAYAMVDCPEPCPPLLNGRFADDRDVSIKCIVIALTEEFFRRELDSLNAVSPSERQFAIIDLIKDGHLKICDNLSR